LNPVQFTLRPNHCFDSHGSQAEDLQRFPFDFLELVRRMEFPF
jgi:hypothetical protein